MKTNRNYFIDILKGIAVFLMLWGHCIQYCVAGSEVDFFENGVFKFIYAFHMPLFMMISGYLFFYSFSKRSLEELLVHRTQTLLQPLVFCSIFNYFVTTGLSGVATGNFGVLLNGKWINNLSSLWFLWSVLTSSIAVAIICKKCTKLIGQILLLFACIIIIALFPNADMNLYMYPYFILGFYYGKYKDRLSLVVQKLNYCSLPLFPVLLCFYQKKHYIYVSGLLPNREYALSQMLIIDVYRWLIGLAGSVFIITLLQVVYQYVITKLTKPRISVGLSKIGGKSLQIYALSVSLLSVYLPKFFPKILGLLSIENIFIKNILVYNFVFTFLLAVTYSFALYFLVKFLEKIQVAKIMFGK